MKTQEEFEIELLNKPNELSFMNNLLFKHQFTENFLIKSRCYYDSWKCLRSQNNLSPYFCFRYLYDSDDDSADDWTDYNDVIEYFRKQKYNYNEDEIYEFFNIAMNDRNDKIFIRPSPDIMF